MPKDVTIGPVPAAMLQQVVNDFESEGARVRVEEGPPGMFTVHASWPQPTAEVITLNTASKRSGRPQPDPEPAGTRRQRRPK